MLKEHTAMAVDEDSRPQKQDNACVPHAMDFSACCMSQEASLAPTLVPFVQAAARTCTWAVRPLRRSLSRSVPRSEISEANKVRHRCGHRHPLRATQDYATRPLSVRDGVTIDRNRFLKKKNF